jgi:hypothetical protein
VERCFASRRGHQPKKIHSAGAACDIDYERANGSQVFERVLYCSNVNPAAIACDCFDLWIAASAIRIDARRQGDQSANSRPIKPPARLGVPRLEPSKIHERVSMRRIEVRVVLPWTELFPLRRSFLCPSSPPVFNRAGRRDILVLQVRCGGACQRRFSFHFTPNYLACAALCALSFRLAMFRLRHRAPEIQLHTFTRNSDRAAAAEKGDASVSQELIDRRSR